LQTDPRGGSGRSLLCVGLVDGQRAGRRVAGVGPAGHPVVGQPLGLARVARLKHLPEVVRLLGERRVVRERRRGRRQLDVGHLRDRAQVRGQRGRAPRRTHEDDTASTGGRDKQRTPGMLPGPWSRSLSRSLVQVTGSGHWSRSLVQVTVQVTGPGHWSRSLVQVPVQVPVPFLQSQMKKVLYLGREPRGRRRRTVAIFLISTH